MVCAQSEVKDQVVLGYCFRDGGLILMAGEDEIYLGVCRFEGRCVGSVPEEHSDAALPIWMSREQCVEEIAADVAALEGQVSDSMQMDEMKLIPLQ
jgi:hypothetical protein